LGLLDDITRQLLMPLAVLKKEQYGFIHGNLVADNILVNDQAQLRFKIANFENSSMYWHGVRFYNSGNYKPKYMFPLKDGFYSINNGPVPIDTYTVHNPQGFYSSYDIYTLLYSLMIEPNIWRVIYPLFYKKR